MVDGLGVLHRQCSRADASRDIVKHTPDGSRCRVGGTEIDDHSSMAGGVTARGGKGAVSDVRNEG